MTRPMPSAPLCWLIPGCKQSSWSARVRPGRQRSCPIGITSSCRPTRAGSRRICASLVAELKPLAQLWDSLAGTPVYMVILPGAVKADLFPGASARPSAASGPMRMRTLPASLRDIDAHFWDWNLWLGAKQLRGQDEIVKAELAKMWRFLLRPLGAAGPPATQQDAISAYLRLRDRREQQLGGHAVIRDLGNAVVTRLQAAGLLPPPPSA